MYHLGLISLSFIDTAIIAIYVAVIIGIAWRVRRGQNTQEDYFLGGRRIFWPLVAVSTFATLFSTITFVTVPAEAYGNGILLACGSFLFLPLLPVAINTVLRKFFDRPTLTSYEYLQVRFNSAVRTMGALYFLFARLLYTCVVLYAASKIFTEIFGVSIYGTIAIIGVATIIYTMIGGMRAVVFTDFIQSLMLLVGVGAILWVVSAGIGFDWVTPWAALIEEDPRYGLAPLFDADMLHIGYQDRINLLLIIYPMLAMPFMMVSADQLVVQRLLSTKGFKQAKRSMYVSAGLGVMVAMLVWLIGVGLVLYFRQNPAPTQLAPGDALGYFISEHLPSPIPGLLCAAMLAMIMSTIDSTINSLSAVLEVDIISRLRRGTKANLNESRLVSLGWGLLAVCVALAVAYRGESGGLPIFELAAVLASGWGIVTASFVLGMLTKWVTAKAMTIGFAAGLVTTVAVQAQYLALPPETRMSFSYTPIIPTFATLAVAMVLSLLRGRKHRGARSEGQWRADPEPSQVFAGERR